MRIKPLWVISAVTAACLAASPARAQTELVIDDFKDGPYSAVRTNNAPSFLTEYQTGAASNIVGGVRQTSFTVSQGMPAFGQPTRMQIRDGSLVISGGYKSYFGLYLGYGYDAAGGIGALDLDLSGNGMACYRCDRFRIELDGSDSELGYAMEVYDVNGHVALFNGTESLANRIYASHVDFQRAGFEEDPAYPVDWNHIAFVFVLFQTGSYLGGHDLAVTKITFTREEQ